MRSPFPVPLCPRRGFRLPSEFAHGYKSPRSRRSSSRPSGKVRRRFSKHFHIELRADELLAKPAVPGFQFCHRTTQWLRRDLRRRRQVRWPALARPVAQRRRWNSQPSRSPMAAHRIRQPDRFDLEFVRYCRLGALPSLISFLRTPEVINFLLYVKSRQGHHRVGVRRGTAAAQGRHGRENAQQRAARTAVDRMIGPCPGNAGAADRWRD